MNGLGYVRLTVYFSICSKENVAVFSCIKFFVAKQLSWASLVRDTCLYREDIEACNHKLKHVDEYGVGRNER